MTYYEYLNGLNHAEDMSLKEHDEQYHPNGFNPETDTCEFRERMAKIDEVDDLGNVKEGGVSGLFTGSAASYNRPSLLKVGTGEGKQVYGWGLYASNQRGVAEKYAEADRKAKEVGREKDSWKYGQQEYELPVPATLEQSGEDKPPQDAVDYLTKFNTIKGDYFKSVGEAMNWFQNDILEKSADEGYGDETVDDAFKHKRFEKEKMAYEWMERNKDVKITPPVIQNMIYEQTFFTNRAPGDESHLLSWYEPVSEENLERIKSRLSKERKTLRVFDPDELGQRPVRDHEFRSFKTDRIYQLISNAFGSPQAASEFLARAGIDGIKYPVDSYGGKPVNNGDKAGWNYVSFRDDNIRIEKKFADGKEVPVKDEKQGVL